MTTPAPPTQQAQGGSKQAQAQQAPFRSGTQRTLSSDGYVNSTQPASGTTDLPDYTPSPNNYLSGLWIHANAPASGNVVSGVTFAGDGPLNFLSSLTFQDSNEKPIVGPFDSYTLADVNKFGGYQNLGDPRASSQYEAVSGNGSTAGTFQCFLYVPVQAVNRDGLGSLQNQSSSSTFTLKMTLNSSGNIYTTAPTTVPTVTIKIYEDGWWKGNKAGAATTPPKAGSTQYWTRGSYNALSGSEQFQVSQGLGYPIRMYMLIDYNTSSSPNTRANGDSDFPDPFQVIYKGTSYWQVGKIFWKDQMSRWYGYYSTTADSANGLENGVFIIPFHLSFTNAPGDELPMAYLGTNQGDYNQFVGSWTNTDKLYVVANYMAFVGAQPSGGGGGTASS
jgi:hypothetical protein